MFQKQTFGSNTSGFGAYELQRAPTGTGHIKYEPVVGTDVVVKSGSSEKVIVKHHCITCMKEYEGKSIEELRLEDYTAGRKGSTTGGIFTGFQLPTENKPLFEGTSFAQPATTSAPLSGGGGLSTSGFGQTNKFSFGGNTQKPTTSTGLFGKKFAFGATSTAGTGIFTFGTAMPSFGGFGTNTQNQESTDLFGAKSAPTGFRSTPASSRFETGLFNAKPQQTTEPTVGSTAPSAPGTSCTGGTSKDPPPLSFHTVHGNNVTLQDGFTARRDSDKYCCSGITFSARPVGVNENVCVRFVEICNAYCSVIRFGFTTHDPTTLDHMLSKTPYIDYTGKPGYWAQELLVQFFETDNILSYYVNSAGDVIFGINEEDKGLLISGVDTKSPLWALIDLYGQCRAVQFADPRALNQMRRSTQSALVEDYRLIAPGTSCTDGTPNNLPPLSFHAVHGPNVRISQDGSIARCVDSGYGVSFSASQLGLMKKCAYVSSKSLALPTAGFVSDSPPTTLRHFLTKALIHLTVTDPATG